MIYKNWHVHLIKYKITREKTIKIYKTKAVKVMRGYPVRNRAGRYPYGYPGPSKFLKNRNKLGGIRGNWFLVHF